MKSMHVYYEEKYQELISKYETTMKDKMTLKVEKERHLVKIKTLEQSVVSLQEKMKGLMVNQSEKNFENSALNESFSVVKKNSKVKTSGKENLPKPGKVDPLTKSLGLSKKRKTNPLLTPIPKDIPNTFINASTGIPNDIKPTIDFFIFWTGIVVITHKA